MQYECNGCDRLLVIRPDPNENYIKCETCGMKYHAQNKGITGKAPDGSAPKTAGV